MNSIIQRSFASGEVAPALYSRVDQARYQTGLRTMRNFITARAGGAQNRTGTTFVAEVKNSSLPVRLIPFTISTSPAQSFVLEFGNLYMRVHQNGQQMSDGSTPRAITAVTNANPAVLTSAAHGFSNGNEINIQGCIGMTELNNRNFIVRNVTTNTFTLTALDGTVIDSTTYGTFIPSAMGVLPSYPNAAKVFELVTPYGFADIFNLKFVQSNDVLTIVHPSYAPRALSYTGAMNFTLTTYSFGPSMAAPTGVTSSSPGDAGLSSANYIVTAVGADGTESLKSSPYTNTHCGSSTNAVTLTWTAPSLSSGQSVSYYNIYRLYAAPGTPYTGGSYCHIGVSQGTSYIDDGHGANLSAFPPITQTLFSSSLNYPSTVAYFQGRLVFANSVNSPQTAWASASGDYLNFTTHVISEDDDMVQFTLNTKQIAPIKHLVDLNKLLILTSAGEYLVAGNANGVLTPSGVNPVQQSYYGSSDLAPLMIGNSALYVQARGAIVRDIDYEFYVNGYRGTDLTVFSSHLFDNYTLSDWAYQQIPGYNVWAVRSDGTLLGLTYIKEQQLVSWHRHDTAGYFESVCSVPEGFTDAVYVVVNRTTDPNHPKRYVERLSSRFIQDNESFCFVDAARTVGMGSAVSSSAGTTLTISGGTTWDYTETLTLTAVPGFPLTGFFDPTMVGNTVLEILSSTGSTIRFSVTAYTSATVVQGTVSTTVPADLRGSATYAYTVAAKKVSGLWHLEGRNISILADGFVIANPNNAIYPTYTVHNGSVTLPNAAGVVAAGLPYLSDIQTLDIDTAQGETLSNKKTIITQVTARFDSTRGVWVGGAPPANDAVNPLQGLTELKIRQSENYGSPVNQTTDNVKINIQSTWNSNGRVFLRQVDPLPCTVLSISPTGLIPATGGA